MKTRYYSIVPPPAGTRYPGPARARAHREIGHGPPGGSRPRDGYVPVRSITRSWVTLAEERTDIMGTQVISPGTYTLMGPGGQLTTDGYRFLLLPPGGDTPAAQQWKAAFDQAGGTYSLQSVLTGLYVGTDAAAGSGNWSLYGAEEPYPWNLAEGADDDPDSFLVTTAGGLPLAPSIMRIYPPVVAVRPPMPGFDSEWTFRRAHDPV
jgi:hypothetical protein